MNELNYPHREWSVAEKIRILACTIELQGAELSGELRHLGVTLRELQCWRSALAQSREFAGARKRICILTRELARKDKALGALRAAREPVTLAQASERR